ncbi:MAG: DUF4266 domain-containing protein [Ectothiorhodospiraceae bacterium]
MKRLAALLLLLVVSATGCSLKPWVKPYERANLADPIMSFSRDPVADNYVRHVHEAREGARGATGGEGGGCGCN